MPTKLYQYYGVLIHVKSVCARLRKPEITSSNPGDAVGQTENSRQVRVVASLDTLGRVVPGRASDIKPVPN